MMHSHILAKKGLEISWLSKSGGRGFTDYFSESISVFCDRKPWPSIEDAIVSLTLVDCCSDLSHTNEGHESLNR